MSRTTYTLYLDQWIRLCNRNTRFRTRGPCSRCGAVKRTLVWYSIKTHEVRCLKCFDAVGEHDRTSPDASGS
jgi:hypothetical protein